jgi:nitrite reductase (NO-forming)
MSDPPTLAAQSHSRQSQLAGQFAFLAVGIGALATVMALIALMVGNTDSPTTAASAAPKTIEVELGDLYVKPATLEVPAGTKVTANVHNAGAMPHDLKLGGTTGTRMLNPGEHQTVDLGVIDADTAAWCTVPGHREAGMEMKISVTGGDVALASAPSAAAADPASDGATIDFAAKPDASWKAKDPAAPAPLPGTVHEVALEAREAVLEVAPGVTQQMWTFNLVGQEPTVPGPVLRGKIGDTFRVTLTNKGEIGHSIDFHASRVAWNDKMRTIKTGESLVYEFTADMAGAYMYHCGTDPALHHIGNGMYGAIIIDPPTLAPVAKEYVLVQSEIYTGPQGQPGSLTKMKNDDWDAVVFNGYVNQYKHQPIRVEPNERIRVWVIDDGPSENSAFHIVGTIFDTTWKEGTYLLQPDARRGGSQVLDLQPAQGGFVEFSFAEAGLYPIVTHKFSNVGKGALGLFQAGDVELPAGGGGH